MAKPKNRVWCPDCGRPKILFDSEKAANLFIKYNGEELTDDVSNLRVYYCPACCGYHISSHKKKGNYDATEKLIAAYHKDKENRHTKKKSEESGVSDEIMEKIEPLINSVYQEFFIRGGHSTDHLGQYIKWNYGDKLTGIERDWLFRKVMEKKRFLCPV